jgi:hypothetical protein
MNRLESALYKSKKASLYSLSAVLVLAAVAMAFKPGTASAGSLSSVMVRFDRLQASTATTGTVCAKPSATGPTEASVQVVFPTGYTLGVAGTFTVNTTTTTWPSGGAAWPGIGTATNVTSQTVTFPSGDLTSTTTLYCFNWSNTTAVTVKGSASSNNTGSVTTQTSTPTVIDTGSYSTQSVSGDQVTVNATVPQSFSFALANPTDNLGSLSTGSVATSPTPATVTINTNAATGWQVWAQDLNTGLKSTAANHTISQTAAGNASTITAGSENTNLGVTQTQTGGTGTITLGNYDGTTAAHGGGLDPTLRAIATSNGTANNAVLSLKNNVGIAATTQAASDYTDTITVVGAGLF